MSLSNVFVYLIGFAGVGKLTTARALAPVLRARVVDNHWINNPILGLIESDGISPLPLAIWDQIAPVRTAVLDTIALHSSPHANFILTNALAEDDARDKDIYDAVLATAERRDALFVPVRLLCSEEELVKRVVAPDRRERLKRTNPETAVRELRTLTLLMTRHANDLTLDTSGTDAETSARLIFDHIGKLAERAALKR